MISANLAKQKERELIIKLVNERKSCRDIAGLLGVSKSKVSFWSARYRKTKNLADLPRSGKPTKLTKNKIAEIKEELSSKALKSQKAGFSSKEVSLLIEKKTGKKYTLRHVQRVLHKIGLSLITPRVHHARKDPKKIEQFRDEFKKNFSRNMWIIPSLHLTKSDFD
ncbi:transposase [Candidatus Woesearchaeota archaeon]|nr:transposase [Candidatus Woesearchaeota archaeon]